MPNSAYQLLEIVGTSHISSDDAIRSGIEKATLTHHKLDWFQVIETRRVATAQEAFATSAERSARHGGDTLLL